MSFSILFCISTDECPLPNVQNGKSYSIRTEHRNTKIGSIEIHVAGYKCNPGYGPIDDNERERKCNPKHPDKFGGSEYVKTNEWSGEDPICKRSGNCH